MIRRLRTSAGAAAPQGGPAAGFTLVEILVALGILLVGMTGVMALLSAGVALEKDGADRAESALLVRELLEQARADAAEAPEDGGPAAAAVPQPVPGRPGVSYTARFTAIPGDPTGRARVVVIEIQREVRGRVRSERYGPYTVILDREFRTKVKEARSGT